MGTNSSSRPGARGATLAESAPIDVYPARWEGDVILTDGGTVHVRPVKPADAPLIDALHQRLSAETVYLRFFSTLPRLSPALLKRFTEVDYTDRLALVAILGDDIVAVARYDRAPSSNEAEVAFLVDDAHQGRGLGTLLLEHLAGAAKHCGIRRFVADTLPNNNRMLSVFRDAGFKDERSFADGVVRVGFDIEPTPASVAAMHDRERLAAARSVTRLLSPRSIAVIGAGRQPDSLGQAIFRNLLAGGFNGPVYPVHPEAYSVASVRSHRSVLDVPDAVDLAVIVVPAPQVVEVVEQCAAKQVGGLVIISAGFAETGPDGAAAEREIVLLARRNGMRVLGPNCMGVANTNPAVSMNCTLSPVSPVPGRIGLLAQSGALGIAILQEARGRGLGVATFVSAGNKADVSGNDLLHYWEEDPHTDVILLYLESFGNPRTFSRVARRVSRSKPIVVVKSGRDRGRSGISELAMDALFRQTGVLRTDTLEQLFDLAQALAHQPLPGGRRVAVVGNAGGPAMLATDACEGAGLEVPALSGLTRSALESQLAGRASTFNPVELSMGASPDDYETTLRCLLADPDIDAVIALFIPALVSGDDSGPPRAAAAVAAAISRAAAQNGAAQPKPVLANFLALRGVPQVLGQGIRPVPSYAFPEAAALALARMAGYAEWRKQPVGCIVEPSGIDIAAAHLLVSTALAEAESQAGQDQAGLVLDAQTSQALLGYYGISLDAPDPDQPRDPGGVETVVGVTQDPSFGPIVSFGLGGPAHELLTDPRNQVLPMTDTDVDRLINSVRGAELLSGYQGAPAVSVAALKDLLLRVNQLVEDFPEIIELRLDPVVVTPVGISAQSAHVRLLRWQPRPELDLRRLR